MTDSIARRCFFFHQNNDKSEKSECRRYLKIMKDGNKEKNDTYRYKEQPYDFFVIMVFFIGGCFFGGLFQCFETSSG